MKENLVKLGLSKAEAEIYLFLIKNKAQSAGKIARETRLNRSSTYSILNQLIDRGLVNIFVKNGIKNFQAAKPSALKNLFEQKKIILQSKNWLEKELGIKITEIVLGWWCSNTSTEKISSL